jgi:hypothetical protein
MLCRFALTPLQLLAASGGRARTISKPADPLGPDSKARSGGLS